MGTDDGCCSTGGAFAECTARVENPFFSAIETKGNPGSQFVLQVPCQPPPKYGGGAGPSGWGASMTMPPTVRNADFMTWPAQVRLGDSWGSLPVRLGTSDGGGGAVPAGL